MSASQTRGLPYPLGSTYTAGGGVKFSVWARTADAVDLLFFDHVDDAQPARVTRLDPVLNRSFSYWHVSVPEALPGQLYAWRVAGDHSPENGLRHHSEAILLDPYARAVAFPAGHDRTVVGDASAAMKSVVTDVGRYNWEGDTPLDRPFSKTVIYELHVKGFTAHETSGPARNVCGLDREPVLFASHEPRPACWTSSGIVA